MVLVGFPSVLLVPLIVPSPLEHDSSRWSRWKRWTIAFIVWNLIVPFTDMAIAFYVSLTLRQIYSSVILLLILGTTPTLATPGGCVFGILTGGPLGGRRPVFNLGTTVSPNITSMLICRTPAGFYLFSSYKRGLMVALFTPVMRGAPTAGSEGLMLFVPETEPIAIASKPARFQRPVQGTKAPANRSKFDVWSKALLIPISGWIISNSICTTIVYGLLFPLLEAYPYIYSSYYAMSREKSGLVFIAPFIGSVLCVFIYFSSPEVPGKPEVEAEARLPGVPSDSRRIVLVYILGWSTRAFFRSLTIRRLVGIGMTLFQLCLFNYYIDLYPTKSASAIAANISHFLCTRMGIRNASMLLACISCTEFPTGIILYVFGRRLRETSRWAKQASANDLISHQRLGSSSQSRVYGYCPHYQYYGRFMTVEFTTNNTGTYDLRM
ncbi:hypothetical protein V8B97DRAFT_2064731 [Scleroderma yunnanense]